MDITPWIDKVWVKLDKMTLGGLEIEETLVNEEGTVVAVWPGLDMVKPGDHIWVKSYGFDHVRIGEEDYYVVDVTSKAILGIRKCASASATTTPSATTSSS